MARFSNVFVTHRNREDNSDSVPFDFTDDNYKKIEQILSKFPTNEKKSATIPLLMMA
jgi:NADH dehydrogenase (ubiquinone) flavoprotein 2